MREYLPLAGLLANVLALPKTIDDQAQADNAFRAMVQSGMPGVTPQQLDQMAPAGESFAGADVPVLGTALRGVGTVGQVLQGVLGAPPSAPRPSLSTYLKLQQVAGEQKKAQAGASLAATFTNPQAKAAAEAGEFSLAYKLQNPNLDADDGTLTADLYTLKHQDPTNPRIAILEATLQDKHRRRIELARATAGVQLDTQAAGRQNRRSEGQSLLNQYGMGDVNAPDLGSFRPMIEEAAQRHGVPPSLALAVAAAESGGNPQALSPKGAMGIMQLMPATAQSLGVDPRDPVQNIEGGVRYLAQQLQRFGDPVLATAAYNAGPEAVAKYGGIPPFAETQGYVAKIHGPGAQPAPRQPLGQVPQGPPTSAPTPGSNTVVTGGSMSSDGGATVNFGRPDAADTDMQLLAREANIDLRQATPQQATYLLNAKKELEEARRQAERESAQIPEGDRQAIVGMRTMQYLLKRALHEFTPEERERFVGVLSNPARSMGQFISPDPRFAKWMAIIGQLQAGKFDLAGKALTETENRITKEFIPTSRELGGAVEFDTKANEYLTSSQFRIEQRLQALGGIGQARETMTAPPDATGSDPVAAAKERLRAKGYAVR